MTDKQILEGLYCCTHDEIRCNKECPYYGTTKYCYDKLSEDALDLIYRQQAEIQRLKDENQALKQSCKSN